MSALTRELPHIARDLCYYHGAWVVGGTAAPQLTTLREVRDIDVFVPFENWGGAASLLSRARLELRATSFGGWRCKIPWDTFAREVTLDVWPSSLENLFSQVLVKHAWHPKSGVRIQRLEEL